MSKKIKAQLTDFTFLLYCGRGQFGSVWLVKDLLEQIVALKLIPKKAFRYLEAEKDGLIAYRNKIKNFDHLVQIYHVGQTEDFFYYTMEAAYSVSDEYYIPITLSSLFEHCLFSPKDTEFFIKNTLSNDVLFFLIFNSKKSSRMTCSQHLVNYHLLYFII